MRNKGFTLIEIIIAITIIAMISGGGLVSVFNALRNSRDAKRKGDLEQIRTALEIYKADKGYYPTPAAGWHNLAIPGDGVYIALVSGGYINAMPIDPKNNNSNPACGVPYTRFGYFYWYLTSQRYQVVAGLEGQKISNCPNWCAGPAPASCYVVANP